MIAHMEELLQRVPRFAGDAEHRQEAFQRIILACRQAYQVVAAPDRNHV